jgi:hypothetical protein
MKKALGNRFLLLTPKNLASHIDFDFSNKLFFFARSKDRKKDSISLLTAKSDFIRFRYIQENGGIWLDADTFVLSDFTDAIYPLMDDGKLAWHSEAIFGAKPGNHIVTETVENMIESERQQFANPGGIKDRIKGCENGEISIIPRNILDPTLDKSYRNTDWEKTTRDDIEVSDFIKNPSCKIIKMFNSNLQGVDFSSMTVEQFIDSGTLMSKIFLHIDSDPDFWIKASEKLEKELL